MDEIASEFSKSHRMCGAHGCIPALGRLRKEETVIKKKRQIIFQISLYPLIKAYIISM
jgi:hypothetical protein